MNILTIVHENDSVTRLAIGCDAAAQATLAVLKTLGYNQVEASNGDKPERARDELDRLNAVLQDIHSHLLQKTGNNIPNPPRF